MSHNEFESSGIIVTDKIEEEVELLQEQLTKFRVVVYFTENFQIQDAKAVIKEAYISENTRKYIIIATKNFNKISQNSLLKLFEEPPLHIYFLLVVESKSVLLNTIKSRLPILKLTLGNKVKKVDINFLKLDNEIIFKFLKDNEKITKEQAKELLQGLFYRATVVDNLKLNKIQLECFDKAYRLLESNVQVSSIFALIFMSFTVKSTSKKR